MSTDEKVDAWMPLWIGAYLADTMTLTTQQHGAYLLLLFAYWRNRGPLDDDDEDLASIVKASPAEWKKLRAKLCKFFTIDNGVWAHGRADKELAAAGMRKAAAVSKAQAAAEARWKKEREQAASNASSDAPSMPGALLKQCPTPSPKEKVSKASPSHPPGGGRFGEFWLAWPKNERKQDKKACAAKWAKGGLDAIADAILADVRAKRGTRKWQEGFIEAPLVYLNNRRWEDGADQGEDAGGPWHETQGGIKAKGADLGVPYTREDECHPFDRYKAKVFKAAGHSPRAAA